LGVSAITESIWKLMLRTPVGHVNQPDNPGHAASSGLDG
jgi:hypothetical protein